MVSIVRSHILRFSRPSQDSQRVFEKVSSSIVVIKTYDAKGNGQSLGSGVVLEDGVVVTNCHVVKEASTIQVLHQETNYPATLRHTDWDRDICTLDVDGFKGYAVTRGSTIRLKVGAKVYAIGAPKGLELTLSDGLISSLRPVPGGQYLQITAPISPGSSGGGLFDDDGFLIGLPTFYLSEGQQLNFAVPVEWINELSKQNTTAPKKEKKTSIGWLNRTVELRERRIGQVSSSTLSVGLKYNLEMPVHGLTSATPTGIPTKLAKRLRPICRPSL